MMKKRILIYSLITIFVPLIVVSVLTALLDFTNRVGFIYLGLMILCATFFTSLELFRIRAHYKLLIPVLAVLVLAYVLVTAIALKTPCWYLIGLLVIPSAIASNYTKWCYPLFSLVAYPIAFSVYGINRYSFEVWLAVVLLTLAFSIWSKYHKTKIYLYDNYGD